MKSHIRFMSTLFSLITLTGSAAIMAYDYGQSGYSNYGGYGQGSYDNYGQSGYGNYNQGSYDNYSQSGYGNYNQGSYDNYSQSGYGNYDQGSSYDNYSQSGYGNYDQGSYDNYSQSGYGNYDQGSSYDNYSQSGYGNYNDYGQQQDQDVSPGPTQGSGYSDWGTGSYADSGSSGYQEPENNYEDEENDQDDFWDAEPQDDSALREFLNNLTLTKNSTCDEVKSQYSTLADAERELNPDTRCEPWYNERDLRKYRGECQTRLSQILGNARQCFASHCSAMLAQYPTIESMKAALSTEGLCNKGSRVRISLCMQQPEYQAKNRAYKNALECY